MPASRGLAEIKSSTKPATCGPSHAGAAKTCVAAAPTLERIPVPGRDNIRLHYIPAATSDHRALNHAAVVIDFVGAMIGGADREGFGIASEWREDSVAIGDARFHRTLRRFVHRYRAETA